MPQFRDPARRQLIPENLARGVYLFALGLSK